MGARAHSFPIGELPDDEGTLTVLVQEWTEPSEESVLAQTTGYYTLTHGQCNGRLDILSVSDRKDVLRCKNCLLRLPLPNDLRTFGDLKNYLARRGSGHTAA